MTSGKGSFDGFQYVPTYFHEFHELFFQVDVGGLLTIVLHGENSWNLSKLIKLRPPGQVLIKVAASPVNPSDDGAWNLDERLLGMIFPHLQGNSQKFVPFWNEQNTYPTKRGKAGKVIDSKIHFGLGYVSSQEGK